MVGGSVQKWGLPYHIEVFLEIPHDSVQEQNLDVFILCYKHYKINAQIKYQMICIVIVLTALIIIIAVLIVHANSKHSA